MATALIYLLVVVAVGAAFFAVAALVFGRGEELAPLAPEATPTRLPSGEIDGEDVRELRFPQALRGYRMTEVDWVLDRLADELDRLGAERDGLLGRVAELEAREPGRPPGPRPDPRTESPADTPTDPRAGSEPGPEPGPGSRR